jgi:hypothetical protein
MRKYRNEKYSVKARGDGRKEIVMVVDVGKRYAEVTRAKQAEYARQEAEFNKMPDSPQKREEARIFKAFRKRAREDYASLPPPPFGPGL